MCIYLSNRDNLTYAKQEHVFPAGLGGIQKLAHGIVSDQANELFSPLEDKLLHHSTLSICRTMLGPGKRGSLDPKKASKSQVCVAQNDDGTLELSYTALATPYTIIQAQFKGNAVSLLCAWKQGMTQEVFELIRDKLLGFSGRFTFIQSSLLDSDALIVGYLDGKYYVASSGERPTAEAIHGMLDKLKHSSDVLEFGHRESQVHQHFQFYENSDTARVYAKTCMNVLAFLQGEEFAKQSCFDEIRNWIINGGSDERYSYPRNVVGDYPAMQKIVPEWAHWCCICQVDSHLCAVICFYNRYIRQFDLGILPVQSFPYANGFICDWINRKEYTLKEYISKLCNDARNAASPGL